MDELIGTIVEAIRDKKGKDIVSLDLSAFDGAVCPAFVICHADSTTQVEAIAGGIEKKTFEELGEKVWRLGRYGLRPCAGPYLPDRVARLLQTRTALGRRSVDPLRFRGVSVILRPRSGTFACNV